MGVAGVGKSDQGRAAADTLALPWLSTGEFLRMLVSGERRKKMLDGHLLADEEIIELADKIFHMIDIKQEFILDGFPRTLAQADWLLAQHKAGLIQISCVLLLEASQDVVTQRLLARGRPDDTKESIDKRFKEYAAVTVPIIEDLAKKGITIHRIDGARTPEEVEVDVLAALKS